VFVTGWTWPDPFKLLPVGLLPIPTGYHFMFDPIPPIGVVVGIFYMLGRHRRSSKLLLPLFATLLVTITATIFFAQKFTLDYEPGRGCPLAGTEHYITVRPLFVPDHVRVFMPDRGQFDGTTCDQFVELMMQEAAPGWFATLTILIAMLSLASFCLGAIFSWPYKTWRESKKEATT
jgi:hypothetical protein